MRIRILLVALLALVAPQARADCFGAGCSLFGGKGGGGGTNSAYWNAFEATLAGCTDGQVPVVTGGAIAGCSTPAGQLDSGYYTAALPSTLLPTHMTCKSLDLPSTLCQEVTTTAGGDAGAGVQFAMNLLMRTWQTANSTYDNTVTDLWLILPPAGTYIQDQRVVWCKSATRPAASAAVPSCDATDSNNSTNPTPTLHVLGTKGVHIVPDRTQVTPSSTGPDGWWKIGDTWNDEVAGSYMPVDFDGPLWIDGTEETNNQSVAYSRMVPIWGDGFSGTLGWKARLYDVDVSGSDTSEGPIFFGSRMNVPLDVDEAAVYTAAAITFWGDGTLSGKDGGVAGGSYAIPIYFSRTNVRYTNGYFYNVAAPYSQYGKAGSPIDVRTAAVVTADVVGDFTTPSLFSGYNMLSVRETGLIQAGSTSANVPQEFYLDNTYEGGTFVATGRLVAGVATQHTLVSFNQPGDVGNFSLEGDWTAWKKPWFVDATQGTYVMQQTGTTNPSNHGAFRCRPGRRPDTVTLANGGATVHLNAPSCRVLAAPNRIGRNSMVTEMVTTGSQIYADPYNHQTSGGGSPADTTGPPLNAILSTVGEKVYDVTVPAATPSAGQCINNINGTPTVGACDVTAQICAPDYEWLVLERASLTNLSAPDGTHSSELHPFITSGPITGSFSWIRRPLMNRDCTGLTNAALDAAASNVTLTGTAVGCSGSGAGMYNQFVDNDAGFGLPVGFASSLGNMSGIGGSSSVPGLTRIPPSYCIRWQFEPRAECPSGTRQGRQCDFGGATGSDCTGTVACSATGTIGAAPTMELRFAIGRMPAPPTCWDDIDNNGDGYQDYDPNATNSQRQGAVAGPACTAIIQDGE